MDKANFVKKHLEPMLKAIDEDVVSADYIREETADYEFVEIAFSDGFMRRVNVSWDSCLALARDVLKSMG